jgi:P pilus assembly chaperone PapD
MSEDNNASPDKASTHAHSDSWQHDPRLSSMDPAKIKFLEEYSARIQKLPNDKKLPFLLSLQAEANRRNLQFSDTETLLLVNVLSTKLSPEQKNRIRMLQTLSKKMADRSS